MTKPLPLNPSLEHLRKEAKALLKAHRNGARSCCEVLRHLRQSSGSTDEEILSAEVSLTEVQFALAMEYGFKSWPELRGYLDTASELSRGVVLRWESVPMRGRTGPASRGERLQPEDARAWTTTRWMTTRADLAELG